MKWIFITGLVFFITACGNDGDAGDAYGEILSKPPFDRLTDSISNDRRNDELYFRRAVLLNEHNFPAPALADFQRAWGLEKEENYALGVSNLLLEKNPDSATLFLLEATRELPRSFFLRIILARSYDARGKTDSALSVCNQILAIDSNQVNALVLKADLLKKKNDIAGETAALEQAYRILPANEQISNRLAYQYAESKDEKLLPLTDTLMKRDSLNILPAPLYLKGLYYSNIKENARAIEWFNKTIQRDHRYMNAYIEKGKILLDESKTAEALKTFELANRINPAFPDAWYWIAQCQEKLGQKLEAKSNYEKAYALDKTFIEAKEAADKISK